VLIFSCTDLPLLRALCHFSSSDLHLPASGNVTCVYVPCSILHNIATLYTLRSSHAVDIMLNKPSRFYQFYKRPLSGIIS